MTADPKTIFLQRWQQLTAKENAPAGSISLSAKADNLRGLMTLTELARAANLISPDAISHLFHTQADAYSCLVDSPDNGLNNYADGAFACVEGVRNEASQWKTSFKPDSVCELECVKKFLSDSKVETDSLESDGKGEDLIGWNTTIPCVNSEDFCSASMRFGQRSSSGSGVTLDMNVANPPYPSTSGIPFHNRKPLSESFGTTFDSTMPNPVPSTSQFSRKPALGAGSQTAIFNKKISSDLQYSTGSTSLFQNAIVRTKPMRLEDITPVENIEEPECPNPKLASFKTASELMMQQNNSHAGAGSCGSYSAGNAASYRPSKKSLGAKRGPSAKFVPPSINKEDVDDRLPFVTKPPAVNSTGSEEPVDPRLKNIEPRMIELITSEIMDHGPPLTWEDIAGLEFVKKTIKEIVIWPMLRPDIFTGLRGPPKGLLLFGPPGTGKTLIGKCIASQSKSTFFSISASSLTSKWVGESEKMVRALFAVARVNQPSVVFIDEIDSLLTHRSDGEHDSSRRIKTEFFVQLDGASTSQEDRILVVGATNRPQELDEAARRRFVKRLYIPLPEREARRQIVCQLMSNLCHKLGTEDLETICNKTEGYSGADMANLCREAALGPIRSLPFQEIENISEDEVRPIESRDFIDALKQVRASVSDRDLNTYLDWNNQYGSWAL